MGNCQNVISDKDTEQEVETTLKQDVAQNMGPQSQQVSETRSEPKASNTQKTNEHSVPQGQEHQETKGSKDAPSSHNHNKTIKIKQRGSALIIKDKGQEKANYVKDALETMPLEFQVKFQEKLEEYGMIGITTKEEYDQVLERIVMERFQPAHRRPPKKDETDMIPKVSTIAEVIDEMLTKSHIVVLTGAGLSVASNLPTFRGEGGYWTLRDKQTKLKAIDFLTHHYFTKSPEEIWRWHHEFRILASQNGPNVSHHAIADFQVFCKEFKKKFSLITQNIDGYHIEAYVKAAAKQKLITLQPNGPKVPMELMTKFGLCDDIYEIHGSVEYMRCDNECQVELYSSPQVGCAVDFVDKCPSCGGVARPHTLFFDECYDDNYYRAHAVMKELDTMDCLVVIGTALETSLAVGIVERARHQKNLIVEINPDPCIKNGNVRHLIGGAEKFVPDLFKGLEKRTLDNIGLKKKLQL